MHGEKQVKIGIGGTTFASEQATIRGGGAPLLMGKDAEVGFSEFSKWYFLSSHYKWETPLTGFQVSSTWVSLFR